MNAVTLASIQPLMADVLLACGILLLVVMDVILPPGHKRSLGYTAVAILTTCLVATFALDLSGPALGGVYQGSALALLFKRLFLSAGILAVLGSLDQVDREFSRRQGEYYQLLLSSLLGMTLLAGARDLILLAVSFELMGIPLYALATYARGGPGVGPKPSEAGLKLYVTGAVSSAISLYGLGLVYGLAGTTSIAGLHEAAFTPLLAVGITLILAGTGFKIGVVPFHMWVPDTYQGTSTPFAGFLSVAPKAAGFAALIQVLVGGFLPYQSRWIPLLVALALVSLAVGNLMALRQTDLKRLLGFSGVSHMGFMLMGLASVAPLGAATLSMARTASRLGAQGTGMPGLDLTSPELHDGLTTMLFYMVGYLVSNMGLFLALEAVAVDAAQGARLVQTEQIEAVAVAGGSRGLVAGGVRRVISIARMKNASALPDESPADFGTIETLAGIAHRSPWIGASMLLFLLSLAGIPFVVGFWTKLYLMIAAWQAGLAPVVIFGASFSVVGLFYYLQVARAIYMRPATRTDPVKVSPALAVAIILCLVGTVGMGAYPAPFIESAQHAAMEFLSGL